MEGKGRYPAVELESDVANPAQVGGRPAVGVMTAICRKTGLRPRVFRPLVPIMVEKAGPRAAFACVSAAAGP